MLLARLTAMRWRRRTREVLEARGTVAVRALAGAERGDGGRVEVAETDGVVTLARRGAHDEAVEPRDAAGAGQEEEEPALRGDRGIDVDEMAVEPRVDACIGGGRRTDQVCRPFDV
jgi:hypothetical protein